MVPASILNEGRTIPTPQPIPLRAGPLTMLFDPEIAALRYLRLGDHEVVRAIFGAIRDRQWGTVYRHVTDLQIRTEDNSFDIRCHVACIEGNIDFRYHATITGDPTGTVTFHFEGQAHSTFQRSRIGLCILHPITECVGKACMVEHADGTTDASRFPESISPTQVFLKVRALRYEPAPGQPIEVRCEGDIFETEDQRNWSDASFKTYSTPLELPFPVELTTGALVTQTIRVSVPEPQRKILPVVQGRPAQLSIITTPVLQLPPLGLVLSPETGELSPENVQRLRALRLAHLRVDLQLSNPAWRSHLQRAVTTASTLGTGLHLAVTVADHSPEPWRALVAECLRLEAPVHLWLVFHQEEEVTSPQTLAIARSELPKVGPNILLAAGTKVAFANLNQHRPGPELNAFLSYPINPQVHASDNLTILENAAAQPMTVETTKQFCARPVVLSPITFRTPLDPAAFIPNATKQDDGLPFAADSRHLSLLGAAWTLASIAGLATGGNLHSLTYYEVTGERGLVRSGTGSLPQALSPLNGSVFPAYHVFADLAGQTRFHATQSTHPLQVVGISFTDPQQGRCVLVANLLGVTQEVKIKSGSAPARVRYLDQTTAVEAIQHPETFRERSGDMFQPVASKIELKMLPWAVARVVLG